LGTLAAVQESALDRATAICVLRGQCPTFSPAQSMRAGKAFTRFAGILGEFDAATERTDKVRSFLDLIALVNEEPSAALLAGRALASGGVRAQRLLCADVLASNDGEDAQHALLAAAVEILDGAPRASSQSERSPPEGEAPVGHKELAPRLKRVVQPHDSVILAMERASWRHARLLDSHVGMLRAALATSRVARECLGRLQRRAAGARSRVARRRAMQALSEGGRPDLVGDLLKHSSSKVRHAAYRALARIGCEQDGHSLPQVLAFVAKERHEPAALAGLECVARADRNGSHTATLLELSAGRGGISPLLDDYFRKQLGDRRRRKLHDDVTRRLMDLYSNQDERELGRFRFSIGMCNDKQSLLDLGDDGFGFKISSQFCNMFESIQPYFGQASSTVVVRNSIEAVARLFGFEIEVMFVGIEFEVGTTLDLTDDSMPPIAIWDGSSPPQSVFSEGMAQDCCGQWSQCDAFFVPDPAWTLSLPTCPCMLNATCPTARWCSCDTDSGDEDCAAEAAAGQCFSRLECMDGWSEDTNHLTQWRKEDHGAAVCIHSSGTGGGHVQRCCYDSSRQLITRGPAAGTPALFHPGRDAAKHMIWDYQSAVDCGLDTMLDSRYLERRPPSSGDNCSDNPSLVETAASLLELKFAQFEQQGAPEGENLGSCAMQHSSCKPFCLSGGLSARKCDQVQFSRVLQFDGVHIAVAEVGGSWIAKFEASSGDLQDRPVDQNRVGGPIPEGKWWLTREDNGLFVAEVFPCCGTELLQRSACNSFSSSGAGPCESAFRLFSTEMETGDHKGILVRTYAADFFTLLNDHENILLVVDYETPLSRPVLEVKTNRRGWKVLWNDSTVPVMSDDLVNSLGLGDGDACFGFAAGRGDAPEYNDGLRCSHGLRMYQDCFSDWDCRSCAEEGTCDAKEMQIRCISGEDASALQQAGYENYLAVSQTDPEEPESTTYIPCPDKRYSYWHFFPPLMELRLEFQCGVEFWLKASVQGCVSPDFGIAAKLVPGVTFQARTIVTPKPKTLNPKSQTLNTQLQPLNPKP